MVARNAYAQLHYSVPRLLLCTVLMTGVYWLPVAGLFFPRAGAKATALLSLAGMLLSYFPTVRFYGVPGIYALAMPFVATLYLGMTWISAARHWRKGAEWKGRFYALNGKPGA
ncbi:MAG TPA: hypothetical protein VLS90_07520 [Thermodesulfobacteriota bacterium]|nr:hypothetical protein [Thermodesulfobacteriota bacterium]